MKTLARPTDKAEILRRLRRVHPESPRRWGRMSAHQMVCHLSDSLRMSTGDKPTRDASTLLYRTVVKWVVLYVPLRWPAGIVTRPEIDQEGAGAKPVDFATDVTQLEALLNLVTAQPRNFDWQRHPLFGTMSGAAWLRWVYRYTDHHLRQFGE